MNLAALAVAAVAAFIASSVWYILFGSTRIRLLKLDPEAAGAMSRPAPWQVLVELLRTLVVAAVVARLAALVGVHAWTGALELALGLWIAFPVVILLGSVQWEKVPLKLAAIHAGDWVVKLVLVALIAGLWR